MGLRPGPSADDHLLRLNETRHPGRLQTYPDLYSPDDRESGQAAGSWGEAWLEPDKILGASSPLAQFAASEYEPSPLSRTSKPVTAKHRPSWSGATGVYMQHNPPTNAASGLARPSADQDPPVAVKTSARGFPSGAATASSPAASARQTGIPVSSMGPTVPNRVLRQGLTQGRVNGNGAGVIEPPIPDDPRTSDSTPAASPTRARERMTSARSVSNKDHNAPASRGIGPGAPRGLPADVDVSAFSSAPAARNKQDS